MEYGRGLRELPPGAIGIIHWAPQVNGSARLYTRKYMSFRTLLVPFMLIAASNAGCVSAPPPGPAPVSLAVAPPPVPLEEKFPLPLVELRGSAADLGTGHGKQLAEPIKLLQDKYLRVYMGSPGHRLLAMAAASLFEAKFRPEHRTETAAMAKEVGMDPREAILAQCFLDLSPMTACSTITLPASAAPDHVARFGRNLDFPSFNIADKYTTVFVYHPDDGRYQFAAIGWPGMAGVLSGMNEHGLALANMEVTRGSRLPDAMPYTLLYRTVLERCRTVDEAVKLLESTPRQTSNNLMLMDASGTRAVVEITPKSVKVRHGTEGSALISTNHQRGEDADTAGRCNRYDLLHDTAKSDYGHIGEKQIESMLAGAAQGDFTLQSMVFEPSTRTLYLAAGRNAASGKFHRLDLKKYFH
ncbi:MAG: hypothetical protein JWN51_3000 [Phycisphaerales bacterium]|nr:hypothetical protein [Phycisphaerales bacterium]